jgi:hypothetical protein
MGLFDRKKKVAPKKAVSPVRATRYSDDYPSAGFVPDMDMGQFGYGASSWGSDSPQSYVDTSPVGSYGSDSSSSYDGCQTDSGSSDSGGGE